VRAVSGRCPRSRRAEHCPPYLCVFSRPSRDKLAFHPAEINYIPAMQWLKKFLWAAVTLAFLLFGIFLGVTVSRWRGSGLRVENTTAVVQQVQTLSDLVTVKYVMQKVEIVDSPPDSTLGKFVQGDNKVLLLAQGIVKAGIDLKKLKPGDVTVSGKKISIKLPPPQITDAYLDDSQTKVIERTTGFLRSLDKDLEQTTRQNAVADIRLAAQANGILNDAKERAQLELAMFLHDAGFEQVEFSGGGPQIPLLKSAPENQP
jgi:hypothetical protein